MAEFVYKHIILRRWLKEKGAERFAWTQLQSQLSWKENPQEFMQLVESAQFDWGNGWDREHLDIIAPVLKDIQQDTQKRNIPLILSFLPVAYQVYAHEIHDEPQKMWAQFATEHNIPFVDYLPLMRKHREKKLYYDHCHPTPQGNKIMGEWLKPQITEILWPTQ